MSTEVKRYDAVHIRYEDNNIRYGEGCEVEMVTARDYDALHAEAEALRAENERLSQQLAQSDSALRESRANDMTNVRTLEDMRERHDALRQELEAIKGQQPVAFYWQDIGYPEPRKHGPYFGWPSESALRNVDGGAIPVPLYALPPATTPQAAGTVGGEAKL